MGFTDTQIADLEAKLDGGKVKTRQQAGQTLSYIEGWHAIAEANRIFGHDAWNRETVHCECVWSGERKTKSGERPAASYIARVRITVLAGDNVIVREGTGAGSGFGFDHGEAHESAIKEAETDAMKRALMTFGNPFGLALYDKTQEGVDKQQKAAPKNAGAPEEWVRKAIGEMERLATLKALGNWWSANQSHIASLPEDERAKLTEAKDKRKTALALPPPPQPGTPDPEALTGKAA